MSVCEGDGTTGDCDGIDLPWLAVMGSVVGCLISVFSSRRHMRVSTSFCHDMIDSIFSTSCWMVTATGTG